MGDRERNIGKKTRMIDALQQAGLDTEEMIDAIRHVEGVIDGAAEVEWYVNERGGDGDMVRRALGREVAAPNR